MNVVIEMKQNKQELIDRVNSAEKELKKSQSLNDKYHAEVLKAQGFNGDLKDKLHRAIRAARTDSDVNNMFKALAWLSRLEERVTRRVYTV